MSAPPLVVILMGSNSDLGHAQAITAALDELGIAHETRVGSAHKTPAHVLALLAAYQAEPRPLVYITIAGRSNALSGFVDAQVTEPVIACPPASSAFAGADIYSSLRMPSGVAPAVVLEPAGAALLAAKMLGLGDEAIRERVAARQRAAGERILADDAGLAAGDEVAPAGGGNEDERAA
ncbi:MAG: AIR carboxylase family protein [Candidatus Promineifilaceae bacterium]